MASAQDLEILNPPKPPCWRDPRYLSRRASRNFVVAVVSAFCAAATLFPPASGYHEPISFQIARHEPLAWLIFCLAGGAVLTALPTLLRAKRHFSGLFCVSVAAGLWALASTNPHSVLHLHLFLYLAGAILIWTWGLWASLQDFRLLCMACFATLGAGACLFSFGIGERVILMSSLAILNILLLTELLE